MPKIRDWQVNETAYATSSYISSWENLSSSKYYTITIFCDVNCDVVIEYAFDDDLQIVRTDTTALVGGSTFELTSPLVTNFVRVSTINIASNPCDLKFQGFFYTDR